MKIKWQKLIISLVIPLGVGVVASVLTQGMTQYGDYRKPPLSPPGWLFPVVWTILYVIMGYASYRIQISYADRREKASALKLYGAQLAINFLWPLVFFGMEQYLVAFFVLLLLWALIFLTIRAFSQIDETAADLLLPYIIWVTFAGYLNVGVYLLN